MSLQPDSPAWLQLAEQTPVPVEGNCSLGRSPSNDVVLNDEKVSRRHAIIHAQGEAEFWLVDLGSSNGTYLNGRRVTQPIQLRDGDLLQVGPFQLRFGQPRASGPVSDAPPMSDLTLVDIKSATCWLLVADIESSTEFLRRSSSDELPMITGRWLSDCKKIVETSGGSINKYLGDGFFAYWPAGPKAIAAITEALAQMRRLQQREQPRFRLVLHLGVVYMGGVASMGEESLSGREVNFIFRMEKLAASLGESRLLSQSAQAALTSLLATTSAGEHPLTSFDGQFPFFTF